MYVLLDQGFVIDPIREGSLDSEGATVVPNAVKNCVQRKKDQGIRAPVLLPFSVGVPRYDKTDIYIKVADEKGGVSYIPLTYTEAKKLRVALKLAMADIKERFQQPRLRRK